MAERITNVVKYAWLGLWFFTNGKVKIPQKKPE